MRKTSFGIFAGAVAFGILAILALDRTTRLVDRMEREAAAAQATPESPKPAEPDVTQLKKEILEAGDLIDFHHLIYEQVGEERWEAEVKPAFARAVAARVAVDQGTPLPTPDDVKEWMRTHRDEAKRLLEESARSR